MEQGFFARVLATALLMASCAPALADNPMRIISRGEAQLSVDIPGKPVQRITAGTVNNQLRRETWQFASGGLDYVGGGTARGDGLSRAFVALMYCGDSPQESCADTEYAAHGTRLASFTYMWRATGAVCGGYLFEGGAVEGGGFRLRSVACSKSGATRTAILAEAAEYLMAARKDGRALASDAATIVAGSAKK